MNGNAADLSRLHDVIAPPALPWWPPAPGWLWVMGAAALAILLFAVRRIASWRRNRYRREALAALEQCGGEVNRMAEILKRTALAAFPRADVAALTGGPWLAFLDRTGGSGYFSGQDWLISSLYDPGSAPPSGEIIEKFRREAASWIRHHQEKAA